MMELAVTCGAVFFGVSTVTGWIAWRFRRLARAVTRGLGVEAAMQQSEQMMKSRLKGDLGHKLLQAGYRNVIMLYGIFAFRALGVMAALAAMWWLGSIGWQRERVQLIAVVIAMLAWFAPEWWLSSRRKKRVYEVSKYLADALDLFVICLEAGLGFNAAIVRVARELKWSSLVLSDELQYTNREILMGRPRGEALRGLGERCGNDDFKSLLAVVIQAEKFGMSMAKTFRIQVESLRTKRRQRIQQIINSMPVKMVFPLVLCIFPELLVVLLGPSAINIWKYFINS